MLNTNNPAIKRIMREAREMSDAGPNLDYAAAPQEDNVFEVRLPTACWVLGC